MSETQEDIERLWAVSELEQRVATEPEAESMRELADHYDDMGWPEEARKLRQQATELPPVRGTTVPPIPVGEEVAPAPRVEKETGLRGRFTPRALVEILRVLHLTGKSGKLVVEAVGDIAATVIIAEGRLVEAHATGGEVGEAAMHLAVRIKGGCYHFAPGKFPTGNEPNLPPDSAALIAAFAADVTQD